MEWISFANLNEQKKWLLYRVEEGKEGTKGQYVALFNSERSTDVLDSCSKCL